MKLVLLSALLLASCSVDSANRTKPQDCGDEFVARRQTKAQGVSAAKRDISKKGFRIIRYDQPWIRTGYWEPYFQPFRHFGIEEANEWDASLDYCQAYNGEMDRQLLMRYGDEILAAAIEDSPQAECRAISILVAMDRLPERQLSDVGTYFSRNESHHRSPNPI